jgi:signal peptidase
MGTLVRTTLQGAVWAVLLGLVALLLAAVLVPRAAGASTFTVLTSSMRPDLAPGTLIVVRPTDQSDIGVGSVITYQLEPNKPAVVTHRVVEQGIDPKGRPAFRTEGDANSSPDANWVRPEQVRGTVWYAIPYAGYAGQLVPTRVRELAVAATGAALVGYAGVMFVLTARERRRVSNA